MRSSASSLKTTPGRDRTCDPRFRKAMLCPLSYGGVASLWLHLQANEAVGAVGVVTDAEVHRLVKRC